MQLLNVRKYLGRESVVSQQKGIISQAEIATRSLSPPNSYNNNIQYNYVHDITAINIQVYYVGIL